MQTVSFPSGTPKKNRTLLKKSFQLQHF